MAPSSRPGGDSELARVSRVYGERGRFGIRRVYDPLTAAGRLGHLEACRILLEALGRVAEGLPALGDREILEVGCGLGGNLHFLAALGVSPSRLHGLDLLPQRVEAAQAINPGIDFRQGNAASLPYPAGSFDLVLQSTCLSSVLDGGIRAAIASEMLRVLRPGGAILSFDFVWNPTNPQTVGIPLGELKRLFPGCSIASRRVYLAPPLLRLLAGRVETLALLLGRIPFLCFHRMAIIRPRPGPDRAPTRSRT